MCAVYTSKVMHNGFKAGELQIDQNRSDTVIFAVPKNILIYTSLFVRKTDSTKKEKENDDN